MKLIEKWKRQTENIYNEHKERFAECIDDISEMCTEVAEINRQRQLRYNQPLIFQNIENYQSQFGVQKTTEEDYLPDEIWSDKYKTTKRFETFAKYFI